MDEPINETFEPELQPETEPTPYTPRPWWQIAFAWIALAALIVGIALYYYHLAKGFS